MWQTEFVLFCVSTFSYTQLITAVEYCSDSEGLGDRSPFDRLYITDESRAYLDEHEARVRVEWPTPSISLYKRTNSDVLSHLNVTVGPFLSAYHDKLSTVYRKLKDCMHERIDTELKSALKHRQETLQTLRDLADKLNVPDFCAEETLTARDVAHAHVAAVWSCVRAGRLAVRKLDDYVGKILNATAPREDIVIAHASKMVTSDGNCVRKVSQSSVALGFELEQSVQNARRHSVHACKQLASCAQLARDDTALRASSLATLLHNCVEA